MCRSVSKRSRISGGIPGLETQEGRLGVRRGAESVSSTKGKEQDLGHWTFVSQPLRSDKSWTRFRKKLFW